MPRSLSNNVGESLFAALARKSEDCNPSNAHFSSFFTANGNSNNSEKAPVKNPVKLIKGIRRLEDEIATALLQADLNMEQFKEVETKRQKIVALARKLNNFPEFAGIDYEELRNNINVEVRQRLEEPAEVRIHLGPTNSGKTFESLEKLAKVGSGTYACPLRMLAREAYDKLVAKCGEENVGLLTGEETINADAPIICCTAEMAPISGELLIIDEAQWVNEPERGYAWTRLLLASRYKHIEVAASLGAEEFLKKVFANVKNVRIIHHERLEPLHWAGKISMAEIPHRSIVIALSRRSVINLADKLRKLGKEVGVLYGGLPPETRIEQIRKFTEGKLDIIVSTDLIGHGINLPADNVIFAQTEKWDGYQTRQLELWEATQIAGRAGRYGLSNEGKIYTLSDGGIGFTPSSKLARRAALAASGQISDELFVEKGKLRPSFQELGMPYPFLLKGALRNWHEIATSELENHSEVQVMDISKIFARFDMVERTFDYDWKDLSSFQAWQLVMLPICATGKNSVIPTIALDVRDNTDENVTQLLRKYSDFRQNDLYTLETMAQIGRDLMLATLAFPEVFDDSIYFEAKRLERESSKIINNLLSENRFGRIPGTCIRCHTECSPNSQKCDYCW